MWLKIREEFNISRLQAGPASTDALRLALNSGNFYTYIQEHEKSEYERYAILMQGGSGKADDPLKWWKMCFHFSYSYNYSLLVWQDHERDFPIISRMARDFLAIPGASVSVERLFSKSRHLCTRGGNVRFRTMVRTRTHPNLTMVRSKVRVQGRTEPMVWF